MSDFELEEKIKDIERAIVLEENSMKELQAKINERAIRVEGLNLLMENLKKKFPVLEKDAEF